jgi:spermidine/putrescine transport system permease protein
LALIFGLPAVFIVIPLVTFLIYSFWRVEDGQLVREFGLSNYFEFLRSDSYRFVLGRTLFMSLQVTAINLVLGYAAALYISQRRGRTKYLMVLALIVPLLMSYIIKIYAMRGLLGTNGQLNQLLMAIGLLSEPSDLFLFNLTAVRITLSVVLLPFMILPIFIALERIPASFLHASADLGASPWQTFRLVTLPMSLPGAVAGAMFCYVLASGDFLAPELVGGTRGFTYGRAVFSQFGMAFNWPFGAALSVILLVVAMSVILVAGRLARPRWADR